MNNAISYYFSHIVTSMQHYFVGMPTIDLVWLSIGLAGQCLFMARFIVQWLHSEKAGKSVIPISFWYFSLIGGITVLAYGVHKLDPVIILGQLPGTFVYTRNLMLIRKQHQSESQTL